MAGGKKSDDFDFDSFGGNDDFDDLFSDNEFGSKEEPAGTKKPESSSFDLDVPSEPVKKSAPPVPPVKKRTAQDFIPDMDALLLTAQ